MGGRAGKEDRRGDGRLKVGPADEATRNRLIAEALKGTTKPRDTSSSVAGSRAANNEMGSAPAPRKPANPAGPAPRGDFSSGLEKALHPKRNLERQLDDAGA